MVRKNRRKSSKKDLAEEILRELQGAKKSDDAPAGLDDLIKSIQNEAKREEKRKKEITAIVKSVGKAKKRPKPKVEEIDPRILELLGIEEYEAELDYEDYVVLLKEVMAQRVVSGGSEERQGDTERLKKELKRARGSSGRFKVKPKKTEKPTFTGRKSRTSQPRQQTSNTITNLGRNEEQVKTEIRTERQEELIPLSSSLTKIDNNLRQVLELDRDKNKREKTAANKLRREKATARRRGVAEWRVDHNLILRN